MIEIPQEVIEAISECRESGERNMFDRSGVIDWCINNGLRDAALWLYEHKKIYGQVLIEYGKLLKD